MAAGCLLKTAAGHGKSGGDRVQIDSLNSLVEHVLHHLRLVKEDYPHVPAFALGHSLGAMITLAAAIRDPQLLCGVVLASPSIRLEAAAGVSPFRQWLVRTVAWMAPNFPLAKVDQRQETRDAQVQERRREDPLLYRGAVKAKFAVALLDMVVEVNQMLFEMSVPFLVLHGTQDRICLPQGSQHLYDNAGNIPKVLLSMIRWS